MSTALWSIDQHD